MRSVARGLSLSGRSVGWNIAAPAGAIVTAPRCETTYAARGESGITAQDVPQVEQGSKEMATVRRSVLKQGHRFMPAPRDQGSGIPSPRAVISKRA